MSDGDGTGIDVDAYPPEWVEQALRDGQFPELLTIFAASGGGALHLAVWREYPDASRHELELALVGMPSRESAVARVAALRAARRGFPEIADDEWAVLARLVWPQLSDQERTDAEAIAGAVGPLAAGTRREPEARGLTERMIREAADRDRRDHPRPGRERVARFLGVSPSTLERAMKDLGMARWPPAPMRRDASAALRPRRAPRS